MKIELKSLFSVPIIKFKFTKHNTYDFPEVKKTVKKPESWIVPLNTSFGLDCDDFFPKNIKIQMIKDLENDVYHVFNSLKIPTEFSIDSIWYNIYHDFQGQEIHDHVQRVGQKNFYWVGVYYNKNPSPTIFHRPYKQHKTSYHEEYSNYDCYMFDYYQDTQCPEVDEGDIILFPPWIEHSVQTESNFADKMRLTFAFNIKYTGE